MEQKDIRRLLGSEYAQEDKFFLEYSIERMELLGRLNDKDEPFIVINAPRGSGKSGLLITHERWLRTAARGNAPILKFQSDLSMPGADLGIGGSIEWWKQRLYRWIISDIADQISVAETEEEVFCVEIAEAEGERHRRKRLARSPSLPSETEVGCQAYAQIVSRSDRTFWLLLDEMDDLYRNNDQVNNFLVGLLQACKVMTKEHNNVRIRLTIRPHIMTILKNDFDIVQRLRPNELEISWSEDELREILVSRIIHYESAGNRQPELALIPPPNYKPTKLSQQCTVIDRYFEDFDLSFRKESKSNYRALHTLSLGRPRWMIEFCIIALNQAKGDRASREDFQRGFNLYGANRVQFLSGEHKSHVPKILEYINAMASARKSVFGPPETLRRIILTDCLGVPRGKTKYVSCELDNEALEIARALYMVEFIRPKQDLGGNRNDHRFVSFLERPSTLASWNSEPTFVWEMHPVFARTLNIVDSATYRVGSEVRLLGEKKPK